MDHGRKNYARRDFFKKVAGGDGDSIVKSSPHAPDALFEKYARKELGPRHYSEDLNDPADPNPPANRVANVTSGLAPYAGAWTAAEVAHLLKRTGFGVKKAAMDAYLAMTPGTAVDSLLAVTSFTPALPSATPLNQYQASYADSSGVAAGANWTGTNMTFVANSNDGSVEYQRQLSLSSWSWGVCLAEGTNIREKMVNFWYHFIPVNYDDVRGSTNNSSTMCHQYMKLLRDNALGNFNTLIRAIAKNPAMLIFLGNQTSTASAPNENFARELLELFMLGKVPTQNYTEDDIKAAAKVLSGWKITSSTVAAYPFVVGFDATKHNQTTKVFSSFFAVPPAVNSSIANQTGANGANEFNQFFDMLFARQGLTIASYICRRLYRFFVFYDIDANTETNVIAPLAATLMSNNWEILPVISQLLKSEHFFDVANRGVMIKSPMDLIAGLVRTLEIPTTSAAGIANQYNVWKVLNDRGSLMEQSYGLVPNVSGWKAYYQSPSYYQNWINTNNIQQRETLITNLLSTNGIGTGTGGLALKLDVFIAVQQFPNATIRIPNDLINLMVSYLLPVDPGADYKFGTPGVNGLKQRTLLSNQITDSYWTDAWDKYITPPAGSSTTQIANFKSDVKGKLTSFFTELLLLAEHQLM